MASRRPEGLGHLPMGSRFLLRLVHLDCQSRLLDLPETSILVDSARTTLNPCADARQMERVVLREGTANVTHKLCSDRG